jgi:hypothetical protein
VGRLEVERITVGVEHEEGEGEVRVARELEAAHEEDGPLAQLRSALIDERPHRAAAEALPSAPPPLRRSGRCRSSRSSTLSSS